jgi:hypothetical protein
MTAQQDPPLHAQTTQTLRRRLEAHGWDPDLADQMAMALVHISRAQVALAGAPDGLLDYQTHRLQSIADTLLTLPPVGRVWYWPGTPLHLTPREDWT